MLFCFVIPMSIPVYFWNEEWKYAISSQMFRNIAPAENKFVAFIAQGEGWHNYHHVFPWDYKAAELGKYGFNLTTALIDMFAKIGWAYDLKEPSKQLINTMIEKNGDGSHSTAQIEPVD
ncbi:acyl-CoA Delta(11) desaturase-like isoform X2 [Belonocnema kinseyi]|uniref:acyl-CoA Delta(11) desaturase-like isoform X2 n=1 Tax=Belonocnema kinseyi TaxID=2817044 RepID=UPI00143D9120|nr:acyl-CoA Delta(11) desaturase-like isoform X2 [Belonocnema kinseyi]